MRWLIDQLWGPSAVGVIGGVPKCSKTWLALDMPLSVATGTACLDRYGVPWSAPYSSIWLRTPCRSCENGSRESLATVAYSSIRSPSTCSRLPCSGSIVSRIALKCVRESLFPQGGQVLKSLIFLRSYPRLEIAAS
ncbi:MAG: AAA family ATPase [Planctomycetes bacterium]|nr:AAA family ATPase [Planctomycetota bacterium]MBL7041084.1 AAA family ATPase [Pirellulaceae bacterium]